MKPTSLGKDTDEWYTTSPSNTMLQDHEIIQTMMTILPKQLDYEKARSKRALTSIILHRAESRLNDAGQPNEPFPLHIACIYCEDAVIMLRK